MTTKPTAEQRRIMEYPLRPLRVAAGAGTGKTTTMALRLAALIQTEGIPPEEALGLTFTNKAAEELADRLRSELPDLARAGSEVEVSTYHGFAHGILREFGAIVGVERDARLITPGYSRQLLRDALGRGSYQSLDLAAAGHRVAELALLAAQLGDHLIQPSALRRAAPEDTDDVWDRRLELTGALEIYESMKQRLSVVDFSDLIALSNRLLATAPEIAERIRSRYRVVLLDEYQDTNPAQRELLRAIFGSGFPITAVGDVAQTIYEWRGAAPDNFAHFPVHFPDAQGDEAKTLPLSVNRRSDRLILDLANGVRARLQNGAGTAELVPERHAELGTVQHAWFRTADEEARWIAAEIRRLHDEDGLRWRDMAILFRKNAQIPLVRDALENEEVPVEVVALGGLLRVPEVADLHAWLRVLGRPDDSPALARILLGSRFRLGLGDLVHLARWSSGDREERGEEDQQPVRRPLIQALDALEELTAVPDDVKARLVAFRDLLTGLVEDAQTMNLVELCRRILDRTGAWPEVEAMSDSARLSARLNLHRFLDLAEDWSPLEGRPSLEAFLDYLELLQQEDAAEDLDTARVGAEDAVALLTVHRAKGLEWPVVFVPAVCAGTFPSYEVRSADPARFPDVVPHSLRIDGGRLAALDEVTREALRAHHEDQEWRVAYVAITRAKHHLYLTGAFWYTLKKEKTPSPLFEIASALDGSVSRGSVEKPGAAPEAIRIQPPSDQDPDPDFPDGWQLLLRSAAADHDFCERWAAERQLTEAYHAQVDQLNIWLDGLPKPVEADEIDPTFSTSVTSLVTYATCPKQFYWSEIDRLPRRVSGPMRRGIEVHRRIELYNRGAIALDEASEDFYDLAPSEKDPDRAGGAFATFKESRFAEERPRFVEAPFELKIEDARVRGRVDAIYEPVPGRWEVVDFKAGSFDEDPIQRIQLEAYALAVGEAGFAVEAPDHVTVTFAYLGGELTEVSEQVDDAWLADAWEHVTDLVAQARAGNYEPTPSPVCRRCDFRHVCEAGKAWLAEHD